MTKQLIALPERDWKLAPRRQRGDISRDWRESPKTPKICGSDPIVRPHNQMSLNPFSSHFDRLNKDSAVKPPPPHVPTFLKTATLWETGSSAQNIPSSPDPQALWILPPPPDSVNAAFITYGIYTDRWWRWEKFPCLCVNVQDSCMIAELVMWRLKTLCMWWSIWRYIY